MSKYLDPTLGCWLLKCDWVDPETEQACTLGKDGGPAQFIDPTGGKDPSTHFQCGRHHGIIPQAEKPEFQLPPGHRLNRDELRGDVDKARVEEEDVNE